MVSMIFKILLILSLLSVQTFAWTGGSVFDGHRNRACTRKFTAKGSRLSWERGFFEDCCIRLYSGSSCSNQMEIKKVSLNSLV